MLPITDPDFYGYRVFVKRGDALARATTANGSEGAVDWKHVVVVDADGGGDFTDIQDAIDSITTAANGNEFLVLITGGSTTTDYTITGAITLKEFVHLQGIGPRVPTLSITISSSTPGIASVGVNHIENLKFSFGGSGTASLTVSSTHATIFKDCIIGGGGKITANAGIFENCIISQDTVVGGHATNHEDSPRFHACQYNGDYIITTAASTSTGQFTNCHISSTKKDTDTEERFMNIDSPDVVFTGCVFTTEDGPLIETSGTYSGCTFFMDDNGAKIFNLTGQAKFSGCTFHITGNDSAAFISISSSANGPNIFSGCTVNTTDAAIFEFASNFSNDDWPLILTGNTIRAGSNGTEQFARWASGGGAGTPIVEVSGNLIHALLTLSLLNNAGTGGDIHFRGTDVRSLWMPVEPNAGTAAGLMGFMPVGVLQAANDVAYMNSGRTPPPVPLDRALSSQLVVASDIALEEDTFTDTNGTNLTAHTSDSGATWVAEAGTIVINSNVAKINAVERYSYTVTDKDGFARVAVKGSGTVFLFFRYVDTNNYWFVEFDTVADDVTLFKKVAGAVTSMGISDLSVGSGFATIAASFVGDEIIVYHGTGQSPSNLIPVIRVSDSDLNTNVKVGIGSRSSSSFDLDDFKFYQSVPADITVDTKMTHEGEPFDDQALTQTLTTIPAVRETPTHVDIDTALDDLEQANYISVRVTLDTTVPDSGKLYILGTLITYLQFADDFRGDASLRQYRPYR